jgi:hypothetical protein
MYAIDGRGRRKECPHPGELRAVRSITGLSHADAEKAGLLGHASHAVCDACLAFFDIDLSRDAGTCPRCNGAAILLQRDSVAAPCPKCRTGTLSAIPTGVVT